MIALMGISGTGKSTLLDSLPLQQAYHVVSASELIKQQINRQSSIEVSSEQMRISATRDMQELLMEAVKLEKQYTTLPIILDCHALIDKGDHIDTVPVYVFEKIGISQIIHLVVSPRDIWSRRKDDKTRTRPEISVEELADHQNKSIAHARAISMAIKASYVETDGLDLHVLLDIQG